MSPSSSSTPCSCTRCRSVVATGLKRMQWPGVTPDWSTAREDRYVRPLDDAASRGGRISSKNVTGSSPHCWNGQDRDPRSTPTAHTHPRPGLQPRKLTLYEAVEPAGKVRRNHTPKAPNHRAPGVAETRQNRCGRLMPAATNLATAGPALAMVSVQLATVRSGTVAGHESDAEMSAFVDVVPGDSATVNGPAVTIPSLLAAITE